MKSGHGQQDGWAAVDWGKLRVLIGRGEVERSNNSSAGLYSIIEAVFASFPRFLTCMNSSSGAFPSLLS